MKFKRDTLSIFEMTLDDSALEKLESALELVECLKQENSQYKTNFEKVWIYIHVSTILFIAQIQIYAFARRI